jgi:hypothetical protein
MTPAKESMNEVQTTVAVVEDTPIIDSTDTAASQETQLSSQDLQLPDLEDFVVANPNKRHKSKPTPLTKLSKATKKTSAISKPASLFEDKPKSHIKKALRSAAVKEDTPDEHFDEMDMMDEFEDTLDYGSNVIDPHTLSQVSHDQ